MICVKVEELEGEDLKRWVEEGKIIIFPTDTYYNIGCNAFDNEAIIRLKGLVGFKGCYSVIAPSKQWIYSNFEARKPFIQKLPGPFTFILNMKRKRLPHDISSGNALGVKIPNHEFTRKIQKTKNILISERLIRVVKVKSVPRRIRKKVDVIIDGGLLEGNDEVVLDFTSGIVKIVR